LANREGDCFLRDLGSSNGTFLRVQKSQPLTANDRIQIGTQVLRIDLDHEPHNPPYTIEISMPL
jgi:pSer/pThr/pTyr-binding forkhead associated (FHA) protein